MTNHTLGIKWFIGGALVVGIVTGVYAVPQPVAERIVHRGKDFNTHKDICGGFAGIPCEEGEFCLLPVGECCCDFQGVCVPQAGACPAVYQPVCGCDGNTYGNFCMAIIAGVNVDHVGECVRVCPGPGPVWLCTPEEFCKVPVGVCDPPGPVGVCTLPPLGCPDNVDPVCGCNGTTYFNACEADADGVNVAYLGPCEDECHPTSDGFGCESATCPSDIPEVLCIGTVVHIDWSSGAIRNLDCDCLDFNYCHVEFGNASPFAVGVCPNNSGTCKVIGQDSDSDGLDDTFRAACHNTP